MPELRLCERSVCFNLFVARPKGIVTKRYCCDKCRHASTESRARSGGRRINPYVKKGFRYVGVCEREDCQNLLFGYSSKRFCSPTCVMAMWSSRNRDKCLDRVKKYAQTEHGRYVRLAWQRSNRDRINALALLRRQTNAYRADRPRRTLKEHNRRMSIMRMHAWASIRNLARQLGGLSNDQD